MIADGVFPLTRNARLWYFLKLFVSFPYPGVDQPHVDVGAGGVEHHGGSNVQFAVASVVLHPLR